MAQERQTLGNQINTQTLRQPSRSVPAYEHRSIHPQTVQDMMLVRSSHDSAASGSDHRDRLPNQNDSIPVANSAQSANELRLGAEDGRNGEDNSFNPVESNHKRRLITASPTVMYIMAGLLMIAGGYLVFSNVRTNDHVKAQVKQMQSASQSNDDAGDNPTDEKPTDAAIRGYTVAPSLARYLDIPKLNIHSRVRPLGIKNDNTLKAPTNGYDVGWYDASSRPGENGAMLIDGHSNVLGKSAVFARLGKLTSGDTVKITRGDGRVLNYKVVTVQTVDNDKVDMASLLVSADTAKPGLNLITCAGDVIPGTLHLDKRTLVQAVLE